MTSLIRITGITTLALLAATAAQAQDVSADPIAGTFNISGGFQPDPMNFEFLSSAVNNVADSVGQGCTGYVNSNPDLRINFTPGSLPLIISANSSSDTTLVINGPDGRWICDDDSGNMGFNPSVTLRNAQPGQYDIWVGSFSNDVAEGTISISELTSY